MSRTPTIPVNFHDVILKKAAEGLSCSKIRDYLEKEHKLEASLSSVTRILRVLKQERQAVAQQVYAEEVAKSANQDVKILGDMIVRCHMESIKAFDEGDPALGSRVADTLIKFVDRRMTLSGMDKPEENEEVLWEALIERLGK